VFENRVLRIFEFKRGHVMGDGESCLTNPFIVCSSTGYYCHGQMKEDEGRGAHSTH
jgi:hypothetical protein